MKLSHDQLLTAAGDAGMTQALRILAKAMSDVLIDEQAKLAIVAAGCTRPESCEETSDSHAPARAICEAELGTHPVRELFRKAVALQFDVK